MLVVLKAEKCVFVSIQRESVLSFFEGYKVLIFITRIKKLKANCGGEFKNYKKCLETFQFGNLRFDKCRKQQSSLEICWNNSYNVDS